MDEVVIKRKVDGLADVESKIIKRGDKSKNPGEEGADEDSADGIPNKELVDAGFAGVALFPGNPRVENISKNSGGGGGN